MKYKRMLEMCENQLMMSNDVNANRRKVSVSERGEPNNDKLVPLEDSIGSTDKTQHVYWFITKNDCSGNLESESELKERVERLSRQYVFQYERGKENNRLHYHLLIYLKVKMRFSALQKIFGKSKIVFIKKGDLQRVRDYCCKEDTRVTYPQFKWKGLQVVDTSYLITREDLRPRQIEIADRYIKDEHPKWGRYIHWYWEAKGNWGKSVTATYMIDQMGAMEVDGACSDILCGITRWIEEFGNCPKIIVIDIPRISMNRVSYRAIEKIKNGKFFSGKYESGMKRFRKPHVIVFSNSAPELDSLSEDRWIIEELKH